MKRNIIMTFDVTILQDILPGIKSIVLRQDLRRYKCHVKKQSHPHLHKAISSRTHEKKVILCYRLETL